MSAEPCFIRLARVQGINPHYRVLFPHSHAGMGWGSSHKPSFAPRASASRVFGFAFPCAYFRYHQHQPSLTSPWLTFVISRNITSARVRPYLSWPWVSNMTSLPKPRADAACLARLPKAWSFSGQSMPLRRMRWEGGYRPFGDPSLGRARQRKAWKQQRDRP